MDLSKIENYLREQRKKAQESDLPLKSVRVVDLGAVVAAPFGATLLGDFGAEVIKIEPPDVPDAIRYWARVENDMEPFWLVNSRNKLPITLNLKHPDAKKILAQLVEKSDILFENMRPGTLDRLGFSAEELWKINKGLIIGRISGYGQSGPYRNKPGFGTLAEGMSGYTYMNTHPGGPPTNPPIALADMIAGTHLALGAMIALRDQKRGERGGKELEVSLYEPLLGYMGGHFLIYSLTGDNPQPMGNESNFTSPRNSFQTKEGKWVALSASAQAPFERMMDLMGRSELKTTPGFRNNQERLQKESRGVLNRIIGDWIWARTLKEVLEECEKAGVTIGPVNSMEDIANDPHVQQRGSLASVYDPASGKTLSFPGAPVRFLETPGQIRFPGLPMGSANEVVLADLLGYSPGEIKGLKAKGAI
jgi:crotonobetainyl-CoA:carnitine CoA-transferase CaiB-like acyl-CoA transferase